MGDDKHWCLRGTNTHKRCTPLWPNRSYGSWILFPQTSSYNFDNIRIVRYLLLPLLEAAPSLLSSLLTLNVSCGCTIAIFCWRRIWRITWTRSWAFFNRIGQDLPLSHAYVYAIHIELLRCWDILETQLCACGAQFAFHSYSRARYRIVWRLSLCNV